MLNLAASFLYLCIALLCARASVAARRAGGRHAFFWTFATALFLALIAWRALAVEEHLRAMLRDLLRSDGVYADRRTIQRPVAAALLIGLVAVTALAWRFRPGMSMARPSEAVRWAITGILLMSSLILLRVTSFHQLDAFLYGPLRLNWLVDIGSSALVGFASWRFVRALERLMARRPRGEGGHFRS